MGRDGRGGDAGRSQRVRSHNSQQRPAEVQTRSHRVYLQSVSQPVHRRGGATITRTNLVKACIKSVSAPFIKGVARQRCHIGQFFRGCG